MKKLLLSAVAFAAFSGTAPASATKISYPSNLLGTWCLTKAEDGWQWFERGKCNGAISSIVLSQNGDYTRVTRDAVESCKADPKSYFKGWTDYTCKVGNRTEKRFQKFLSDGDELGLGGWGNDPNPQGD